MQSQQGNHLIANSVNAASNSPSQNRARNGSNSLLSKPIS